MSDLKKVLVYDTHSYEKENFLREAEIRGIRIEFCDSKLNSRTASLANGYGAVCSFVNDKVDADCLKALAKIGVKHIALRSAGFNHVDIGAARELGLGVSRVPSYSPEAVAEFAVALLLSIDRKVHRSYHRVRELNFSLNGLVGCGLHDKTVGVVGAGKIGLAFARIMKGFGSEVLYSDIERNEKAEGELGLEHRELKDLVRESDIVSLHAPLNKATHHMFDQEMFELLPHGAVLINTSRGGLVDTKALIQSLKSGKLRGAGLDVYEEEEAYFFEDHSNDFLEDDQLARLLTFPNVIVTSHQGFLTDFALREIAETTTQNLSQFFSGEEILNSV